MRIIAHRGLVDGPNKDLENKPSTIERALNQGFEVEVDVWLENDKWFLGHDMPTYPVEFSYLNNLNFWIHAKTIETLERLLAFKHLNAFWHQTDDVTLTSHNYLWVYPGQKTTRHSVCVMPEKFMPIDDLVNLPCMAVCTDYANTVRSLFK